MPQDDALERLEKKLDSGASTPLKRSTLFGSPVNAPHEWALEKAPAVARVVRRMKPLELFFLGSMAFFVIALLIATLLFFAGNNTVSTKNVGIEIAGPSEVGAGSTLSLQVIVTNRNAVPMELADLVVEFPDGTRSAVDISTDLPRIRESLGTIQPGKSINRTVRATLFGLQGEDLTVKAFVEYRVPSSNAIFVSEGMHTIRINESPATISVDADTEAVSGQRATFTVSVRSNAPDVLKDMLLTASYPPGFSFISSSPSPASGKGVWELGDIEPGGERKVTITGTFSGEEGEGRVMHFVAGTRKADSDDVIAAPLATSDMSLTVTKPFVTVRLALEGDYSSVHPISRGEEVYGTVSWTNNLPVRIQNLSVKLLIQGQALDRAAIRASQGFYDSNTSSIVWNRSTDARFADIGPGESGVEEFSFKTLPATSGELRNSEVSLAVTINANRFSEENVPEALEASAALKALVTTSLAFQRSLVSFAGPLPPKVGSQTSYSVTWNVVNSGNAVANARVSGILPQYAVFLQGGSGITYDETDRSVTWNIGDITSGGSQSGIFQIALTPSLSQVGTNPVLVSTQLFTALDRFARVDITRSVQDLTTRDASSGGGTVVQ